MAEQKYPFTKVVVVSNNGDTLTEGEMVVSAENVIFEDDKTLVDVLNKTKEELDNKIKYVTEAEYIELLNNAGGVLNDNVTYFIR